MKCALCAPARLRAHFSPGCASGTSAYSTVLYSTVLYIGRGGRRRRRQGQGRAGGSHSQEFGRERQKCENAPSPFITSPHTAIDHPLDSIIARSLCASCLLTTSALSVVRSLTMRGAEKASLDTREAGRAGDDGVAAAMPAAAAPATAEACHVLGASDPRSSAACVPTRPSPPAWEPPAASDSR